MNNEYRTYRTLLCSKNAYISLATTENAESCKHRTSSCNKNEYKRNYKLLIKDNKATLPLTVLPSQMTNSHNSSKLTQLHGLRFYILCSPNVCKQTYSSSKVIANCQSEYKIVSIIIQWLRSCSSLRSSSCNDVDRPIRLSMLNGRGRCSRSR